MSADPLDTKPWKPPEPADKEFVAMVRRELRVARFRAYGTIGRVPPPKPKPGRVYRKGPRLPLAPSLVRSNDRTCKRCRCSVDDYTPGCTICTARHSMRRVHAKEREQRAAQREGILTPS